MSNKILGYVIIGIVAIFAIFLIFRPHSIVQTPSPEGILLFTRYDCPHCKDVEEYITNNKIADKIKFTSLEIHDQNNANLFIEKATGCGIPENAMGVPMVWDGKNCFSGSDDIVNFFIGATTGK